MDTTTYSYADPACLVMVKLPAMDSDSNQLAYDTHFMIGPFDDLESAKEYIEEMHSDPGSTMIMDLYPPSLSDGIIKERLNNDSAPGDTRFAALGRMVVRKTLKFHEASIKQLCAEQAIADLKVAGASKKKIAAAEKLRLQAAKEYDRQEFGYDDICCMLQSLNLLPIDFQG